MKCCVLFVNEATVYTVQRMAVHKVLLGPMRVRSRPMESG